MLPQRGRAGSGLGRVISPMGCAQNRKRSSITHQLQQDTFARIGGLYFDPPPRPLRFPAHLIAQPHLSHSGGRFFPEDRGSAP